MGDRGPGAPPRTAAEIAKDIKFSGPARRLLGPDLAPGAFLKRLVEGRHHADAIRFMAHSMVAREAVWWACLCVRHPEGQSLPDAERAALRSAVRWVLEPTRDHQQAAGAAGTAAGHRTPAGCCARAAFFSGNAPEPGKPLAPADLRVAAQLVAGSVLLAAVKGRPADLSANYCLFIALGLDVDYGKNRWE